VDWWGCRAFSVWEAWVTGINEPPLLSTTQRPPQFGRQKVQILDQGHVLVHATSETIVAEKGEDAAALVRRLVAQRGVGPADAVEIVFKAGAPQYAIVEWGKGGCQGEPLRRTPP
jgi:hypothetical protein